MASGLLDNILSKLSNSFKVKSPITTF